MPSNSSTFEKLFLPIFTYIFLNLGTYVSCIEIGNNLSLYKIEFWEGFSQATQVVGWLKILKQDKTKRKKTKTKKIVKLSKITVNKIYWKRHGERKKNHCLNVYIIGTCQTWVFFTCCSWISCTCSSSDLSCCTIFCILMALHLQSRWSSNSSFLAFIFCKRVNALATKTTM
jgi:hypothetical protein